MIGFTLRQLQIFLEIAQHSHISRAARQLNLSQSAASNALAELESRYGHPLFDRVGRRIQLNSWGEELRPRAEALLQQAQTLDQFLCKHEGAGTLQVGATLTIGNHLTIPLMQHYRQRYPNVNLGLEVANTRTIVSKVLNYELDVGLIEGETSHPDLEVIPWMRDELVVFCAPTHPQAGQMLSDDALVAARWILREPGSGTRQTFDRAMRGLVPQLKIELELQQTEAIRQAVAANLGFGCLSRLAVADAFATGLLAPMATKRDLTREFYLVLHRHKYRSAHLEHWVDLLMNSHADHA